MCIVQAEPFSWPNNKKSLTIPVYIPALYPSRGLTINAPLWHTLFNPTYITRLLL
jgi:hypothetical protein